MGKSNEGCLKIQPLPRERFKFSTRDGSSPASETLGPRVARHTVPLTQPRSSTPAPGPQGRASLALTLVSHMSAAAASPPLEGGLAGAK